MRACVRVCEREWDDYQQTELKALLHPQLSVHSEHANPLYKDFSLSLSRTKGDTLSETESHFHTNISRPAVIFCFTPTIFCFSSDLLSIDFLFFLIVPDRLVKLKYQITRQICSIAIILNSEIN